MTSRSVAVAISIMPAMREQRERVVLAAGQVVAARRSRDESSHRQQADDDQHQRDEEAEVVGRPRRRSCVALRSQSETARDAGADQADDAQAGDRHPLAGLAQRLGQQRGDRRPRSRTASERWRAAKDSIIGLIMSLGFSRRGPGVRSRARARTVRALRRAAVPAGPAPVGTAASPAPGRVDRRLHRRAGTRSAATPIRTAIATVGTSTQRSRARQVGQRAVLLVGHRRRSSRAGTSRACRRPTG